MPSLIKCKRSTSLILYIAAGLIFIVLLSLVLAKVWPWGSDFLIYYYPLSEKWLDGCHEIYDPNISALFYPPWSLFVIVPLGLLPIQIAHGFQLTISLVLILLSVRLVQGTKPFPRYFYLLALINLHSFDLYIRGQLDAVVLVGLALGYWAIQKRKPVWLSLGFCLMVMKPPLNVLLVLVLYLISIRKWSKRELLTAFTAPAVMVLVSSLMVGIDWPVKYIKNMTPTIDYLSISIWKAAKMIHIPLWIVGIIACVMIYLFVRVSLKVGTTQYSLGIALATTFAFTIYANGDHYVLLIPALLFVLQNSLKLGLLAYALTLTPLLRLAWGPGVSSIDILYPLILLACTYYIKKPQERSCGSSISNC